MTAFVTARRHDNARRPAPLARTATEPVLRGPAASQSRGVARLTGMSRTHRRMVSLPTIPSTQPLPSPASDTGQSGSPTTSASPSTTTAATARAVPAVPVSTTQTTSPILTREEKAEIERLALEEDRRVASREFALYKSEPLEEAGTSFDLVKYWDVSFSLSRRQL